MSTDFKQSVKFLDFERPRVAYGIAIGDEPILFSRDGKGINYPCAKGRRTTCGCSTWMEVRESSLPISVRIHPVLRLFQQLDIIRGHREADVVVLRKAEVTRVLSA